MRYNSIINNVKANEWGLTIQQAYLFSWMYELPSWASKIDVEGLTYYFASKTKAVEELPILTNKTDTMYRFYKQLESMDLILITKVNGKDYISLTEKSKKWNNWQSDNSENNPTILGNLSGNGSENNPTYNIYNTNNINKDNRQILFSESIYNDYDYLRNHLAKDEKFKLDYPGVDLKSYIEDCLAWSVSKNNKSTNNGWLLTLRQWIKRAKLKNELKLNPDFVKKQQGHTNH